MFRAVIRQYSARTEEPMKRLLHVPDRRVTSITFTPESAEVRYTEGEHLRMATFLRKDNPDLWEGIDVPV